MLNKQAVKVLTPPLKWAGGKRWLVPYLTPIWNQYQGYRLVEPFCGGLAVALGLSPGEAILNDINEHVVYFYKWLQKGFISDLKMSNESKYFYKQREKFNQLVINGGAASKEASEIFYYLNRTCFNGLCRFNSQGEFNVPFGKYSKINYQRDFSEYKHVTKKWKFVCGEFDNLKLEDTDFVYADPPYDVEFRQYSKNGFAWGDQIRLAEWLSKHNGPVLLSNQATKRIIELYQDLGFELTYLDGPRRISCNGDRTSAREVLATIGI